MTTSASGTFQLDTAPTLAPRQLGVDLPEPLHLLALVALALHEFPPRACDRLRALGLTEQCAQRARDLAGVDLHDERVRARRDRLVHPWQVRENAGAATRHRLPDRPRRAVARRDRHASVSGGVPVGHLLV